MYYYADGDFTTLLNVCLITVLVIAFEHAIKNMTITIPF